MPRIRYTDDTPSAPVGYDLFEPGEERDVTDEQAAELVRNVHFHLVDAPAPQLPQAPAVPSAPPLTQTSVPTVVQAPTPPESPPAAPGPAGEPATPIPGQGG